MIAVLGYCCSLCGKDEPIGYLSAWSVSYYRPQSLDLVKSQASARSVKSLSRWILGSFEFTPDQAFCAWFRKYEQRLIDTNDYRLGYKSNAGWFLVNRYGYSRHEGLTASFDVGRLVRKYNVGDALNITIRNRTSDTLKIYASNGFPVGMVAPGQRLVWAEGWNTGVFARRGNRDFGLLEDPSISGGAFGRLPRLSRVSVTQSNGWDHHKMTLTLSQSDFR